MKGSRLKEYTNIKEKKLCKKCKNSLWIEKTK